MKEPGVPMDGFKDSNPKDAAGVDRAPLMYNGSVAEIEESLAALEGRLKYGGYNYRVVGVLASVYISAMLRHLKRYTEGENRDRATRVHHLGSIRRCCGVLIEAEAAGVLVDDRPPSIDLTETLANAEAVAAHLRELYGDRKPRHYTIADTRPRPGADLDVALGPDGVREEELPEPSFGAADTGEIAAALRSSEDDILPPPRTCPECRCILLVHETGICEPCAQRGRNG